MIYLGRINKGSINRQQPDEATKCKIATRNEHFGKYFCQKGQEAR